MEKTFPALWPVCPPRAHAFLCLGWWGKALRRTRASLVKNCYCRTLVFNLCREDGPSRPRALRYVRGCMSCSGRDRPAPTTEAPFTLRAGCTPHSVGGEAPRLHVAAWITPRRGCRNHPATATWFQCHIFVGGAPKGALQPCASLSCRTLVAGSTWPTPHLQMGSTVRTELVCPNDGGIRLPYHWEKWLTDEKLLET